MRIRSKPARIAELKRWLTKYRNVTWREFVKETGGTQNQFYHLREELGLTKKNMALSEAMKNSHLRRKAENAVEAKQKDNEEYLAGKTKVEAPKQQLLIEGTTPDFIWYEMDLMQRKLGDISLRLNHVMKVAQARDNDQKKMMRDLISENTNLRVESNSLRQQVAELTEMINGTPV